MTGDIEGNRNTNLEFAYLPLSFSTAEAEVQIRFSEFDSQPKVMRIVGSAAPFQGQGTDVSQAQDQTVMTKTLLQSTKSGETKQRQTGKLKSIHAQSEKDSS